jgi:DNA-binding transcriptional LysR family regulator
VEVVIHGTIWDAKIDSVADITISINRDDDAPAGSRPLTQERVALLCAPKFRGSISKPEDIRNMPRIYVLGRQDYWELYTRSIGLENIEHGSGYRANASNIALEMAANGMGLVTSLVGLSQAYVDRGLLVEPFEERPISTWGYYIHAANRSMSNAATKLFKWICEHESQRHAP